MWHKKVDHVFVNFWLLNSQARLHTRLKQYGFPLTLFEVKFAQNLNENRFYAKDIGDIECKLWKMIKFTLWISWRKTWTKLHRFQNSRVKGHAVPMVTKMPRESNVWLKVLLDLDVFHNPVRDANIIRNGQRQLPAPAPHFWMAWTLHWFRYILLTFTKFTICTHTQVTQCQWSS